MTDKELGSMSDHQQKDTTKFWSVADDGLVIVRIGDPGDHPHLTFRVKYPEDAESWIAVEGPPSADAIDREDCHELAALLRHYAQHGRFPSPEERAVLQEAETRPIGHGLTANLIFTGLAELGSRLTELVADTGPNAPLSSAVKHIAQAMELIAGEVDRLEEMDEPKEQKP
jgi:hypothetical protein